MRCSPRVFTLVLLILNVNINFMQVFAGDSKDFEIQIGYDKLPYDLNKDAGGNNYLSLLYEGGVFPTCDGFERRAGIQPPCLPYI